MTAFGIITFIVGTLASVLVFLSYIFKNQVWLRIVNMIASIIFVAYGLCLYCGTDFSWTSWTALPVIILNASSATVHAVYLIRYWLKKRNNEHTAVRSYAEEETDGE